VFFGVLIPAISQNVGITSQKAEACLLMLPGWQAGNKQTDKIPAANEKKTEIMLLSKDINKIAELKNGFTPQIHPWCPCHGIAYLLACMLC
jgi:hypothetical protein